MPWARYETHLSPTSPLPGRKRLSRSIRQATTNELTVQLAAPRSSGNSVSVAVAPLPGSAITGATVYVPDPAFKLLPGSWGASSPSDSSKISSPVLETSRESYQPAHVVKIKINPILSTDSSGKVISSVHLTPDTVKDPTVHKVECFVSRNNNYNNIINDSGSIIGDCVRISVNDSEEMVQRMAENCFYYGNYQTNHNNGSILTMTSGQCSPSDTLDSGTCSDLDGTPPPLPKKKSQSVILLGQTGEQNGRGGEDGGGIAIGRNGHTRTGSLTSSGAEIDSDDNESNVSCDSLNRRAQIKEEEVVKDGDQDQDGEEIVSKLKEVDLVSGNDNDDYDNDNEVVLLKITNISTGTESKVEPLSNGQQSSSCQANAKPEKMTPMITECTYEERKREIDCGSNGVNNNSNNNNNNNNISSSSTSSNNNGSCNNSNEDDRNSGNEGQEIKYVYEDDRYYKFHINELEPEGNEKKEGLECENDEFFAGYKILDKEAIRSAKGTVRGVKNRVRAGIATFLQNPSSKKPKSWKVESQVPSLRGKERDKSGRKRESGSKRLRRRQTQNVNDQM
ncbi:hypothetical protein KQX54_008584 [Cotesia glomerata]|uniref:Uncharacterized protein n=1 Tax=Cotesia glomerata TaxID=32391 RepID=A0AAV7IVB7_COTGL|nr:hypothetical protein KQX54_008584 [Cotesia glomerata]